MTSNSGQEPFLSENQQELLQSALREGYFKVPREVTLVDLAERHGLSDREVSEQIRRGLEVLVRDATIDD